MKLADYLKKNALTHENFSRRVGVTRPVITQIIGGKRNPSLKLVQRIEDETNGEVGFHDLFNPDVPSKRRGKK